MNLHLAISWSREGMRALLSITCCTTWSGKQAVNGDIRRRLFNLIRELCRCRHRVRGSGDLHANLHPQLDTSVSEEYLVAVQVLVIPSNVFNMMSFIPARDFTLLCIGSDCVLHHFSITLGRNMLHVRTTVSYLAI